MWRNYLTVGLRAMLNNKVYAFVNVVGLAIGIAAAVLIVLYVRFETGYDKWLPASDRIVQLQMTVKPRDGEASRSALAPRVAVDHLRREFPELEQVVGMMKSRTAIVHEGEARYSDVYWSDPNFFQVFDLPFVRGDPRTALRDVNSVVLTEAGAVLRKRGRAMLEEAMARTDGNRSRAAKLLDVSRQLLQYMLGGKS